MINFRKIKSFNYDYFLIYMVDESQLKIYIKYVK